MTPNKLIATTLVSVSEGDQDWGTGDGQPLIKVPVFDEAEKEARSPRTSLVEKEEIA